MTTAVQRRRGTNTEHASFTGLEGELSVNTTNESVHVHDGSTAGGFELARADASNIVATSIDINGGTIDGTAIGASSASTGAFTTLTATGLTVDTNTLYVDSTNNRVGVGTTSPASTFEIAKNDQTNGATLSITNSFNSSGWDAGDIIGSIDFRTDDTSTTQPIRGQIKLFEDSASGTTYANSNAMSFSTGRNDTLNERMIIDSSGNVGIGVVPEAWHSAFTEVLQVGPASLITSGGDNARVFSNAYYDGAYKRIGTGYAHSYEQTGGTHRWFSAASGSADSSISWAESMRIDSSGNVGIGTSSPTGKLDVTISTDARMYVDDNISEVGSGNFAFQVTNSAGSALKPMGFRAEDIRFATGSTERMRIDGGGNAIFTKSGGAYLQLKDASAVRGAINVTTSDGLVFTTGSSFTERMRIDSSGQVGIGTSSPVSAVSIQKGSGANAYIEVAGNNNTLGSASMLFGQDSGSYGYCWNRANQAILFGTNSAERMRIDASGNLRLTGTAPSSEDNISTINFFNTSSGLNLASIEGKRTAGGTNYGSLIFNTTSSGTSAERMRIDSSGNLSVGDSNSYTHRLFVKGVGTNEAVGLAVGTNGDNIIRFYNSGLGTAGAITVASGGTTVAYNTSSDQRLKENIADADDAGSKIDAIQVRQYDWKADGSHQDYGMIAQELQTVAPEAVSGDADSEDMMGVDYSKLVPMLIKEIQSLRNRVAQLEE